jgi:hypothetical protein
MVTRWVCQNIAQIEAQPIFGQNVCTTFTVEKLRPKFLGYLCNFQKTAQSISQ